MRCIDLSNRAWPVTGQGATTFARYLKLRVFLCARVLYSQNSHEKSQRIYISKLEFNISTLLKIVLGISLILVLLCQRHVYKYNIILNDDRNVLLRLTIPTANTEFNDCFRKNALRGESNETFAESRKFCYSPFSIPQREKNLISARAY